MKFIKYLNEGIPQKNLTKITIELRDPDGSMKRFLEEIKTRANVGHSFSVFVDKEGDNPVSIGFDGDGAFYIKKVEQEKIDA